MSRKKSSSSSATTNNTTNQNSYLEEGAQGAQIDGSGNVVTFENLDAETIARAFDSLDGISGDAFQSLDGLGKLGFDALANFVSSNEFIVSETQRNFLDGISANESGRDSLVAGFRDELGNQNRDFLSNLQTNEIGRNTLFSGFRDSLGDQNENFQERLLDLAQPESDNNKIALAAVSIVALGGAYILLKK